MTAVLSQEENRLARSQATRPIWLAGGVRGAASGAAAAVPRVMSLMAQRSTRAIFALYQFMNRLIDRLIDR